MITTSSLEKNDLSEQKSLAPETEQLIDFKSGYYNTPNFLIDSLLSEKKIDAIDFTIMNYIIRQTNGWKRDWAWLAINLIAEKTNISSNTVRTRLKKLSNLNLISRIDFDVNRVTHTYIFINNERTKTIITKLLAGEISPSYITGNPNSKLLQNNFFDKVKDKFSSLLKNLTNNVIPDIDKNKIISNTSKEHTTSINEVPTSPNAPPPPSPDEEIKNKIIKDNLKIQTTEKKDYVVVSLENFDNEQKEIYKILSECTFNKKNINFNKKTAINLIKKYKLINNRALLDVVKEKIDYLSFEKINPDIHSPAQVLFNMIVNDREPSKAYKLNKEVRNIDKDTETWKPVLMSINEVVNKVTEDGAKMIIRQKICMLLNRIKEYNNSFDKKDLYNKICNLVSVTNKKIEELNIFSPERINQIKIYLSDLSENNLVEA